jgi:hypothetical protein
MIAWKVEPGCMKAITAQDWELLGCFGVEPQLAEPDIPWCCNDSVYVVEVDGLSLSCAIQPSYRDVRLVIRRGSQRLYELNAVGVEDIRVIDESERDILEVRLSHQEGLRVQLRPTFEITQGYQNLP